MFDDVDIGSGYDRFGGDGVSLGEVSGGYAPVADSALGGGYYGDVASTLGALADSGSQGYSTGGLGSWAQTDPAAPATNIQQMDGSPNVGSVTSKDMEAATGEEPSMFKKLASSVGLTKKDGDLDIDKLVKLGIGLGGAYSSYMKNKAAGDTQRQQTAAQLQQSLQQNVNNNWTPQQSQWANSFLNTPVNPNRGTVRAGEGGIKSIIPGQGYAEGGGIGYLGDTRYGNTPLADPAPAPSGLDLQSLLPDNIFSRTRRAREEGAGIAPSVEILQRGNTPRISHQYSLKEIMEALPKLMGSGNDYAAGGEIMEDRPRQGAFGMVDGEGDGHSDSVPINAAQGEYMIDAETVSALGNGSNEAGAHILDEWRQKLREFKRGADPSQIADTTPEELMPPMGDQ